MNSVPWEEGNMITESDIAAENIGTINKLLSSEDPLTLVGGEQAGETAILPENLKSLLRQILAEMAKGNEVAVLR